MNFGFLARCDVQGASFHQFGAPASGAPALLSHVGNETCRVIFLGRLYYADDLRRRLTDEHRPAKTSSAAQHVLAAYRQGGLEGLTWIEGDYAFVLWDARERRLLASRDPQGGFPLFWVRDGDAVAVSNAMRPLLDLLPSHTLNREYVAEFLMLPGTGVQELNSEQCAYEGVHRVLSGTWLEVLPGGRTELVRWWDWLAEAEEPANLEQDAIAARFGELLEGAVRQRRVGRTAAHLSGGMDSTAVALLAARQAQAAGEEPVHGISLLYDRFPVLARESAYIESAVCQPGLQAHQLPGDEYLGFDGYRSEIKTDEPALVFYQSTSNQAMLEHAAELGAHTLMTGYGADELVGQPPFHLHELLRRGRWISAWRESTRWARAGNRNRWRYLGVFGLIPWFPASLRGGLSCWRKRGQVSWEKQREFTIGPWVRPEFARQHRLWQRAVARLQRVTNRCRPLARSLTLEFLDLNIGDALRWELGAPRGILTVHPFRDPRLVRFSLGFQGRICGDPKRQKPILVDALPGVLPAKIYQRRNKGHFNEVFFAGLSRNIPMLESLVRNVQVDDVGLLDKGELVHCLHKAALGVAEHAQGVDRLNLTLGLLKWLSVQQTALRDPAPRMWRLDPALSSQADRPPAAALRSQESLLRRHAPSRERVGADAAPPRDTRIGSQP